MISYTGQLVGGTPEAIALLLIVSTLDKLVLDDSWQLGSEFLQNMAYRLQNNTTLKTLDLGGCGLQPTDGDALSRGLENMTTLEYLNLDSNYQMGGFNVPHAAYSNLRELNLQETGMIDTQVVPIANIIANGTVLQYLNLTHCHRMTNFGLIARALKTNEGLKTLCVEHQPQLSSADITTLCDSLKVNTCLTELSIDVHGRKFDVSQITDMLRENRTLEYLSFGLSTIPLDKQLKLSQSAIETPRRKRLVLPFSVSCGENAATLAFCLGFYASDAGKEWTHEGIASRIFNWNEERMTLFTRTQDESPRYKECKFRGLTDLPMWRIEQCYYHDE